MRKSGRIHFAFLPFLAFAFLYAFACKVHAQINTFPHFENFENEYLGASNQCDPVAILYGSWRNITTDSLDWIGDNNDTPSGGTGPAVDHTLGNIYGMYVYLESSCDQYGYPAKLGTLMSSWYDFRNLSAPIKWEFWYNMYGSTMGDMHVDADTTRGASWMNDLVPAWTDNNTLWKRKVIDLSAFAGKDSVRLRIRGITGSNSASDMALDDILVYKQIPVDLGVSSIQQNSQCGLSAAETLQVKIINYGRDTLFTGDSLPLCYRVDNQAQVCETFVLAAAFPPMATQTFTFTLGADLSLPGLHSITVTAQKAGDTNGWNNSLSKDVRNYPLVTSFPSVENFENGPGVWRSEGISNHWSFGHPAKTTLNTAASGQNCWMTGATNANYPNGEDAWVVGPCLNLAGRCNPWIDLKTWWKSETQYDGAVLQYSLNGGQTWSRLGNFGDPNNWYNANNIVGNPGLQSHGWTGRDTIVPASGGWVMSRHALTGLGGQNKVLLRIAFASDPDINDEGFAFDDVTVYDQVYLGQDLALCQPSGSVTLDARGQAGWTYLWSNSATTQTITVNTPGTYWVRVTNGGCVRYDTLQVTGIGPGFTVSLGPDTTVCGSYLISPANVPQASWHWSTGDSVQRLPVTTTGNYFVDVTTPCSTVRSDTVSVTILPVPVLNLGPDTSVCGAYEIVADSGAASYLWIGGATTQSLTADTSGSYWAQATGLSGCTARDTLQLTVNPLPQPFIGPDTFICAGDTICLSAGSDPGSTYSWSQGASGPNQCLNSAAVYIVTALSQQGCSAADTMVLSMPDPPVAGFTTDTTNCPVIAFIDQSTGAPDSWFWDFGDGSTSTASNPFHDYTAAGSGVYPVSLIVTNACGTDTLGGFALVQCVIAREPGIAGDIVLYPNPNHGVLNLRSELPFPQDASIEIFSMDGRMLFSEDIPEGQKTLSWKWREGGYSGMLIVRLKAGGMSRAMWMKSE